MIDYHIHLERGSYGLPWLEQFLAVGNERGIGQFGIVEHLYLFQEAKGLLFDNDHVKAKQVCRINDYFEFISAVKAAGLPVRCGLEVDYVPEKEELIRQFVKDLPVDFIIGSVHYLGEWGFDLSSDWLQRDKEKVYRQYFSVLLQAAASGIFDILGHCGNIAYHGHHLDSNLEEELFQAFFHDLAGSDIVVEINTGGLYRPAGIVFPQLKYLPLLYQLGLAVTTSSDVHEPFHTGWQINKLAIPALKQAGYQCLQAFHCRQREEIKI